MVNVFSATRKKDENPNEETKQVPKQEEPLTQSSDNSANALKKLKQEEAQLAEERQNLEQLKEQLRKKIKDQIDNRKENLQKLRTEVSDLKAECAELNQTLQS